MQLPFGEINALNIVIGAPGMFAAAELSGVFVAVGNHSQKFSTKFSKFQKFFFQKFFRGNKKAPIVIGAVLQLVGLELKLGRIKL